jgi:hypothetical protein
VAGPDGELIVNGFDCTLDDRPCSPSTLQGSGLTWTLLDNSLYFTNVTITGGAVLTAPAVDEDSVGGELIIEATGRVTVEAGSRINMSGLGYGGGGGGGGLQYCDGEAQCKFGLGGAVGFSDPDGSPGTDGDVVQCVQGYTPATVGSGAGGAGGGYGGLPGNNGGGCPARCINHPEPLGNGNGGAGGGPFGGAGGSDHGLGNTCEHRLHCDSDEGPDGAPPLGSPVPAASGVRGGYAAHGGNGDSSTNDLVLVGSGGGGGAGGGKSSGWCCGAALGGHGGVWGGQGRPGCTGGGGGGGGAAGGGSIAIRARDIDIAGDLFADGAGRADLLAGYGAGGGILLSARHGLTVSGGTIRTLGGFSDNIGTALNGGSLKLFYWQFYGNMPDSSRAGRLYTRDLSE